MLFERVGIRILGLVRYVGALALLYWDAMRWLIHGILHRRLRYEETILQSHSLTIRSFGIVSLVVSFVGMILAFQMAYVLKTLGSKSAIMKRKIFDQRQIARASDLGIGVSSPSEIDIIPADPYSEAFKTEVANTLLAG